MLVSGFAINNNTSGDGGGGGSPIDNNDNLNDIRETRALGLPSVTFWPVEGFNGAWVAEQLIVGHRIIPSIRFPMPDQWQANTTTANGNPQGYPLEIPGWQRLGLFGVPIILRSDNICDTYTRPARYRFATNELIVANSPLIYKVHDDGSYDQEAAVDCLASPDIWTAEAVLWSLTGWFHALTTAIPNPTWVEYIENNEGTYEQLGSYISGTNFVADATIRSTKSVRMADYIQAKLLENPSYSTANLTSDINAFRNVQYAAFQASLVAGFPAAWQSVPFICMGYSSGPNMELPQTLSTVGRYQVPCAGNTPSTYLTSDKRKSSLTMPKWTEVFNAIPVWENIESGKNPADIWRDVSIQITDGGAVGGIVSTTNPTEILTPERWSAFCEFLYWSLRGTPPYTRVRLRYYQDTRTLPTSKFFGSVPKTQALAAGYADAATITHEAYGMGPVLAVDRICENNTLRQYWLQSTPIVGAGTIPTTNKLANPSFNLPAFPPSGPDNRHRWLVCSANTNEASMIYRTDPKNTYDGAIQVWATAMKLGEETLIYAFTPCILGQVVVTLPEWGGVTIDLTNKISGYWIVKPPPVPPGFVVEELE